MIELKKAQVHERLKKVELACEELIAKKEKITYKSISEVTGIPAKTLSQGKLYRQLINDSKECLKDSDSEEVKSLKNELEYKETIIKKLRMQNRELMTKLGMQEKL